MPDRMKKATPLKYPIEKRCPHCDASFLVHEPSRRWKVYCSRECYCAGKRHTPESLYAAFLSRLHKIENGCWIYQGATDQWGYTHMAVEQRRFQAHRWSYEKHVGPIPPGACIMHTCDMPSCVNPDHLKVGTNRLNSRDRSMKGRSGADLTPDQVRDIRKLLKAGATSQADIARRFETQPATIWKIKHGRGYGWVE